MCLDLIFKGHILYQLGGWPDVLGGSLVLAHVPYAFKVSLFNAAKRLGYKRAFFLDSSILPFISLNKIFNRIKTDGYFVMGNSHTLFPFMNVEVAKGFGLSLEDTKAIPSCSAGIFGVDFTHPIGNELFERYYKAACDPIAFFSPRSDQTALSIILYKMGICNFVPITKLAGRKDFRYHRYAFFIIDREYVKQ